MLKKGRKMEQLLFNRKETEDGGETCLETEVKMRIFPTLSAISLLGHVTLGLLLPKAEEVFAVISDCCDL